MHLLVEIHNNSFKCKFFNFGRFDAGFCDFIIISFWDFLVTFCLQFLAVLICPFLGTKYCEKTVIDTRLNGIDTCFLYHFTLYSIINKGVMKRAVKWMSTVNQIEKSRMFDVDGSSYDQLYCKRCSPIRRCMVNTYPLCTHLFTSRSLYISRPGRKMQAALF